MCVPFFIAAFFCFFASLTLVPVAALTTNEVVPHLPENCLIYSSENSERCLRCAKDYILMEGVCTDNRNNASFENCIERTKYGDCSLCECGYSLIIDTNKCIPTPSQITGCQIFHKLHDWLCVRPKPEYQIIQSKLGTFIAVEYSRSTHCEIKSYENGECLRCHSGYMLNATSTQCVFANTKNPIENIYYSFYQDATLMSRDIRFVAQEGRVFAIINECQSYLINPTTNAITCLQCSLDRARNASGTVCVRKPFDSCEIVSDDDWRICKQCRHPRIYFVFNNKSCKRRRKPRVEKCKELEKQSDGCHICYPPFELIGSTCVKPYLLMTEIEGSLSLNKMSNCGYAVTQHACLECRPGFILDTSGSCTYLTIHNQNCIMANIYGQCIECSIGYYPNSGKCWLSDTNCLIKKNNQIDSQCELCPHQYYIGINKTCMQASAYCLQTNGKDINCLHCEDKYYLAMFDDVQFCKNLTETKEYCLSSNGRDDKCEVCHHLFEATIDGKCESKIIHDGVRCQYQKSYIKGDETYCRLHNFPNMMLCREFDTKHNRCVKCGVGFYLSPKGYCFELQFCQVTNGIDEVCFQGVNQNTYISKSDGKSVDTLIGCATNQRDAICLSCSINNEIGLVSSDDGSCIPMREINQKVWNNCISVRKQVREFGEQTPQYVCVLCLNRYFINEDGVCKSIEDNGCIVSDGRENACLACVENHVLVNGKCELMTVDQIPFCREMKNGSRVCTQCENLFYLLETPYQISISCTPIHMPNCLLSDGINNECLQCIDGMTYFGVQKLCVHLHCEEIDDTSKQCKKCRPGFHLVPVKNKGAICQADYEGNCLERTDQGHCINCVPGYYYFKTLPHYSCYKINIPYCLQIDNTLSFKCIECEEGYFISSQFACLPINNRCAAFNVHSMCQECNPPYRLTKHNTCELVSRCWETIQNKCVKCESGYYLSNQQCLKIPNCKQSLGILQICLVCKEGHTLVNFICLKDISLENCEEFDTNLASQCVRCASLFYMNPDVKTDSRVCLPISISNCEESEGIENRCSVCEMKGYVLAKESECIEFSNCLLTNGINSCFMCEEGYYLAQSVISEAKKIGGRSCIKQPINIANCIQYAIDEPRCARCENFYTIHDDYLGCTRIQEGYLGNCLETDGLQVSCQQCSDGYVIGEKYNQFSMSFSCFRYKDIDTGCKFTRQYNSLNCDICFDDFYLDKGKCLLRQTNNSVCLEYHPEQDVCLVCSNGFVFDSFGDCVAIQEQLKVRNCKEYERNSNVCKECSSRLNLDVIEYYLDRDKNTCVNVLHLMCRSFDEHSMTCQKKFIHSCLVYDEELLQKCIGCENGFYIRDGICEQHDVIRNCEEYDQLQQNLCLKCEINYHLSERRAECVHSGIDNCLRLSSKNRNECEECGSERYQVDSDTGQCVESILKFCLIIKVSVQQVKCVRCYDEYAWNPVNQVCQRVKSDINCRNYVVVEGGTNCSECEPGYFLNSELDCLPFISQCQLSQCSTYSVNSIRESYVCEICAAGYAVDLMNKGQCVLESIIQIGENSDDDSDDIEDAALTSSDPSIFTSMVILIIVVLPLVILTLRFCKKYTFQSENRPPIITTTNTTTELIEQPSFDATHCRDELPSMTEPA